jgi:cobalamin biosynthetic protein CobC
MVPGSSWAIQTLPLVLCQQYPFIKQVLLPKKGYSEHKRAWQTQGVSIVQYHDLPSEEQLQACDVCVLINPNNPSTQLCSVQTVLNIAKQLQHNSGMLIVDEAFIDTQPQCSVLAYRGENTIVLRSLGKFFGLAGLRVGSIMANETILQSCQSLLPPWALSHPARYISQQALQDGPWINKTIMHLQQQAEKLAALCKHNLEHAAFECAVLHTDLFVSLFFDSKTSALDYHHRLCQQGIYTRLLDDQCGIRIGLPENTQAHWQRLEHGLLQAALAFKKDITYA